MMALTFRKFDPYAFLQKEIAANACAKPATPAKVLLPTVNLSTFSTISSGGLPDCKMGAPSSSPAADRPIGTSAALHGIALPDCVVELAREWRDGLAKLQAMSCPRHFKSNRWELLISDARRFIDEWALQCASLGWTTLETFGVNPQAPDTRHDGKGLVVLLGGHHLIDIWADKATVRSPSSGNVLTIYRRRTLGQITVWDLPG
jgi:hypothetical protein